MEHLQAIEQIFKRYASSYHFYLRNFTTGEVHELGAASRFPICSCFKLAVLMAYFDSLESEAALDEEVTIEPQDVSPGVGVINYFTSPLRLTYFQLAQMMMAFSDGTATDLLIRKVGLDRVDQKLQKFTKNSKLTRNLKDLVLDFQSRFNVDDLKSGKSAGEFVFTDYTNAQDLTSLAIAASEFQPRKVPPLRYQECLSVRRLMARTALFFAPGVSLLGKTGSLGHAHFANDCGVITYKNAPVGAFGVTAAGFKHDKDVVELLFGYVGLHILNLLGLPPAANSRLCPETRSKFE